MRPSPKLKHLSASLVFIVILVPVVRAETLTYGVDAGIGESDNVTLAPSDKISQTIATADMDFAIKEQSRRLDVDAKGNFTYLDYLQNAFGSQFIGRFDGVAQVALVPERFTWVLQDDYGQATLDPFAPVTPTNLENINYVSTGPDVSLRLGGTSFINITARYARAQYETSPFDSNRLLGSVAWGLDLSPRSNVSLNGNTERVRFENTVVNTDFERSSGYGRYELHGARNDFAVNLGATTISQDGTSTTGGLAKLELTRTLSSAAKLIFSAGHNLTDASTSFSTLQSGTVGTIGTAPSTTGAVGTAPAALTSNSYTTNYASVGDRKSVV